MFRSSILILLFIGLNIGLKAQEEQTPFKKGLWLTGLDGAISSTDSTIDTLSTNSFSTAYAFNISSNKIFKDRWAAGLRLTASRASSSGFLDRESESIFIGPSITHYFSASKDGSLFLELSPGYVRFFDKSESQPGVPTILESVDGNGFGTSLRFGYAHLVTEKILFNFGMNITNFWIVADRISEPSGISRTEDLTIGSIAFNFGFSVLLEKFFF